MLDRNSAHPLRPLRTKLRSYLLAFGLIAGATAVLFVLSSVAHLGHVSIVYIVPVFVAAFWLGLGPAIFAALASVAASAFFFYPPIYDFRVHDPQQVLDLVLFMVAALVTGHLTTSLKRQTRIAQERERETQILQGELRARSETELLREAFIGSVSHELRTPLASIMGASTVLGQAPAVARDSRLSALTNVVRDEAERLNSDIQNLLDATRISREGIRPHAEWVDPGDVINSAIERLARRLTQHKVELEIPPDLPLIHTDPALLGQAIVQIVNNAAKYSSTGSVVRITAQHSDGRLVLSVSDRGAGLTAEEQAHLWAKFYRGGRHKTSVSGSGLGLWIARAFVTASGGTIDAFSEGTGRGTVFSISFPVAQDAMPVVADEADE